MPEKKRPPTILVPPSFRRPRLATILSARGAYIVVILIATLANLEPDWHDGRAVERLARALSPHLRWGDTIDGIRNILLFAGFGAVWEVTSSSGRLRDALWRATLYGCLLSISVETLQLFSPVRNASIADVMTNTAGTFIGALGLALLVAMTRARRDARSYIALPAFLPALGQFLAILAEGVAPLLRQEQLPLGGGPLTRLRATLAAATFTVSSIPVTDLVFSLPAGFLGVTALTEIGMSRTTAAAIVGAIGVVLSFVAEVAHGTTGEVIVWGAAVAHGAGIVIGAVLAVAFLPSITQRLRGVQRVRAFLVAYIAFLVVWLWRPFVPRWPLWAGFAEMTAVNWTPMAGLSQRGDVFSAAKVVQLFALMMPVGALLAVWPLRRRGLLRWVLPGVWLSAVFALGHILIEERMFDITNFMIMVAGAWLGWWVVRRADVPERGTLLSSDRG